MVLVSVVMCSYNHEKYIAESIDSVLNQTCPDLELLITDDCSTDSSPKIIADYEKKTQEYTLFSIPKTWVFQGP